MRQLVFIDVFASQKGGTDQQQPEVTTCNFCLDFLVELRADIDLAIIPELQQIGTGCLEQAAKFGNQLIARLWSPPDLVMGVGHKNANQLLAFGHRFTGGGFATSRDGRIVLNVPREFVRIPLGLLNVRIVAFKPTVTLLRLTASFRVRHDSKRQPIVFRNFIDATLPVAQRFLSPDRVLFLEESGQHVRQRNRPGYGKLQ